MKCCLRVLTISSAVTIMMAFATDALIAQSTGKWTNIGPFGGFISSLVIDPQNPATLYTGAGAIVFKSTDEGANWNPINSTLLGVHSLAVNPRTPSTLYAGGPGGVFKSIDGGASWR